MYAPKTWYGVNGIFTGPVCFGVLATRSVKSNLLNGFLDCDQFHRGEISVDANQRSNSKLYSVSSAGFSLARLRS